MSDYGAKVKKDGGTIGNVTVPGQMVWKIL